MYKYRAEPLSNADIMDLTSQLRKILGCSPSDPLNILAILEYAMPQLYDDFQFLIVNQKDMKLNVHAYTEPKTNTIYIREDIYERARSGEGRDRFTIAHEIGHYILHNSNLVRLTRVFPNETIKPYEDIEWQADAFAGELLCPARAIKNMDVCEAANKYGVSLQAAISQKKKSHNC